MLYYLTILRPLNCIMSLVAVFVGGLLVTDIQTLIYSPVLYAAMFAALVITGAGNVINDYIDVESDKVNRSRRPIASGRISKNAALAYFVLLFVVGILATLLVNNLYLTTIAVINSVVLVIYSTHLQNKILLGNLAVSYLVGSTFLFGGAAFYNLTLPILLMLLAMLSNFAREIVKDLEDLEGDRRGFLKRLVSNVKKKVAERFDLVDGKAKLKFSKRRAMATAKISLLFAVVLSPIPYIINLLGLSYVVLVVITDLIFIYCIFLISKAETKKQFKRVSKKIKLGMLFGLLSFIIGILV